MSIANVKVSTFRRFFSSSSRELALLSLIVVIAVVVQFRTGGIFLSQSNIYDLLRETSILLMVSLGMMVVIISGGIDLSIGSVMALSGMLGAMILRDNKDISLVLLFLIAIGIGSICGLINGLVVSKIFIYPIIATLGTQYIFRGTIYLFSHGSWVPQVDMTPEFISITTTDFLGINALVWIASIIGLLSFFFLRYTRVGRNIFAIGNSEESAAITGIQTSRVKTFAYIICGAICGLAGLLWVTKYGNAQSESCAGYEIGIIAAVVLGGVSISGGVGTVFGVVLGAILMGTLNNILPLIQVSSYWQMAIKGFIILASVIINALTQRSMNKQALKRRG